MIRRAAQLPDLAPAAVVPGVSPLATRLAAWGAIVGTAILLPAATPLHAQTIRGYLLESGSDHPIEAGLVVLLTEAGDSVTSTVTDEDGYFSLTSPEPGSFRLLAVALGYRRTPAGIFDLGEDGEMSVEFRIAPRPLPLDEILASVDQPAMDHELV
ncbi:MAG TPA: carboxypeptidase-like regulatory domain-containing protein, partial [Longimicrobiales bacterium]|nr:carboxypeptidase-like regulatory domain-containing protein [Longimicrobiales bacterium]